MRRRKACNSCNDDKVRRVVAVVPYRRPCERRDPYAAASRFGRMVATFHFNRRPGLWVPAFAGTTTSYVATPARSIDSNFRQLIPSLRAKRSNPWRNTCRTMDCFVASLLAMTMDKQQHSRGAIRPGDADNFGPHQTEGAGNAGRWCARSRAWCGSKHAR
jgi:hypothetical protein